MSALQATQDVLVAAGPHAGHILDLWRVALVVCAAVYVAVLAALVIALVRRRRAGERQLGTAVASATGVSALLLAGLLVASLKTDLALAALPKDDALEIEIVAHQFWWELRYRDGPVHGHFVTANEMHVPTGRNVRLKLASDDVIHSVWVPSLFGKRDLIPGRPTQLAFRADRDGIYRGNCAEFCGPQHAQMALLIVAEPAEAFTAWAQRQRATVQPPADAVLARGQEIFLRSSCPMCHAVQGTSAQAQRAPDLTHIGGRQTLASGALSLDTDTLAAWIADPQRFKPGSRMPGHAFAPDELRALAAWLHSLR